MDPYKGWNEVANNGVSAHAAADETRAKRSDGELSPITSGLVSTIARLELPESVRAAVKRGN